MFKTIAKFFDTKQDTFSADKDDTAAQRSYIVRLNLHVMTGSWHPNSEYLL